MNKTPKFNIGDTVIYKEKYQRILTGTITLIGTQGSSIVYGLQLENGAGTHCKEKDIIRKK